MHYVLGYPSQLTNLSVSVDLPDRAVRLVILGYTSAMVFDSILSAPR